MQNKNLEATIKVFNEIYPVITDFFQNSIGSKNESVLSYGRLNFELDYVSLDQYEVTARFGDTILVLIKGKEGMGGLGAYKKIDILYSDKNQDCFACYSESDIGFRRMSIIPTSIGVA